MSRLSVLWYNWNIIPRTMRARATNNASMVKNGQYWRSLHYVIKQCFDNISPSTEVMLLKHHTSHCLRILYKESKFGWYSSIIKGTSLGGQSSFSTVYRLPLQQCNWNIDTSHRQRMRCKSSKFSWNRYITKGTLLGGQSCFSSISRLPLEGYNRYICLTVWDALQTVRVCFKKVNNEGHFTIRSN